MRGTHQNAVAGIDATGIIPAYAGNTYSDTDSIHFIGDHPRVCGEHNPNHGSNFPCWGSSPRMRGTPTSLQASTRNDGIIPAYAGNTSARIAARPVHRDHPRVCGEHTTENGDAMADEGSSPRMRGTLHCPPRGKGRSGIIPAYAGNTSIS